MSTHSSITAKLSDGSFKSVYVQFDGYISGVGQTLATHYSTQDKIDALMAHGDISSLDEYCDKPDGHTYDTPAKGRTVYYGRDRGEENVSGGKGDSAIEAHRNGPGKQSYDYLWDGEAWTVGFRSGAGRSLADLLAGEEE